MYIWYYLVRLCDCSQKIQPSSFGPQRYCAWNLDPHYESEVWKWGSRSGHKYVIAECFCEAPSAAWDLDLDPQKKYSSVLSVTELNHIPMTTKLYFYEGIKAKNHFYMWQQTSVFLPFLFFFQVHINLQKPTNTCTEDLEWRAVSQSGPCFFDLLNSSAAHKNTRSLHWHSVWAGALEPSPRVVCWLDSSKLNWPPPAPCKCSSKQFADTDGQSFN